MEKLLFIPNKIPEWVENHKDKFNKLVYKSLKQQNRLYEVAMQKMLFGSLSKDLQDQIKKEAQVSSSFEKAGPPSAPSGGADGNSPDSVIYADGVVPSWIERYKGEFSSMVYKSLKSQGKLSDSAMQKMLFGSLSSDIQEKIQKEVEEAKKNATAQASSGASGGAGASGANLEVLLTKISSQLSEIISLLKEKR